MNKSYVDELFIKNKSGKLIKYLQDNAWKLSVDDIQYICEESIDKRFYSVAIFIFDVIKIKEVSIYNILKAFDITNYLMYHNHIELLSYLFKPYRYEYELLIYYNVDFVGDIRNVDTIKYLLDIKLPIDTVSDDILYHIFDYSYYNSTHVKILKYMLSAKMLCLHSFIHMKEVETFINRMHMVIKSCSMMSLLFSPEIIDIYPSLHPVNFIMNLRKSYNIIVKN